MEYNSHATKLTLLRYTNKLKKKKNKKKGKINSLINTENKLGLPKGRGLGAGQNGGKKLRDTNL